VCVCVCVYRYELVIVGDRREQPLLEVVVENISMGRGYKDKDNNINTDAQCLKKLQLIISLVAK
jgi:hypothetical protein